MHPQDAGRSMPTSPLPPDAGSQMPHSAGQGAGAADAQAKTRTGIKAARLQKLAAEKRDPPVLMALFLACWRWLMPPAAGFGPPRRIARMPRLAVAAALRRPPRLAPVHAPPLRLLT